MKQWDFAGDEVVFMVAATAVGGWGVITWFLPLRRARLTPIPGRAVLLWTPALALAGLLLVLQNWADPQSVAGHLDYTLLFLAGGCAWLTLVARILAMLGISPRDDAIDGRNPAATAVIAGALLGAMAVYAGGNVGSGPTIWTTIFPAFVGTVCLLVLWIIVEVGAGVSEAVAVERDLATGIRHAGWLIATGLILGRAIAGDWTSWSSTFSDMIMQGLPALALTVVHIIVTRMLRPTVSHPRPSVSTAGIIPAVIYLMLALAYVIYLGPADIGKHVITYEEYTGHK